jgi:hypothetical protein
MKVSLHRCRAAGNGKKPRTLRWAAVAVVRASCQAGVLDPTRPGLPWGHHRFFGVNPHFNYTIISAKTQEINKSKSFSH